MLKNRLHLYLVLILGFVTLLFVVGQPFQQVDALSAPSPQPTSAALDPHVIMNRVAAFYGESAPTHLRWVMANRGAAIAQVSQDVVDGDLSQRMYVIEAEGSFSVNQMRVPPGSPVPTGQYLVAIADPISGDVTDVTLSPTPVPLEPLGVVTD